MKRLVTAMACAAFLAADPLVTLAQAPKAAPQAVAPAPAAATPKVAAQSVAPAPAPAAAAPAARAKKRAWTRADARVCLEFPTNLQIIRCAEKYRHMRAPA